VAAWHNQLPSWHFPGNNDNQLKPSGKSLCYDRNPNGAPPEYKSDALPGDLICA
jgi:hypothetical protein